MTIGASSSIDNITYSDKMPKVKLDELVKVSYAPDSQEIGTGSVHYSDISPVPVVPPRRVSVPAQHTTLDMTDFYSYMYMRRDFKG